MMLRGVDRIVLRVPNVASAARYYRDVLGLSLVREDARVANLRFADDSAELVLHADPDLPAEATYFLVDDVRNMYARRDELKLTFVSPPSRIARGYRAIVRDPFGTVLQILDRSGATSADDAEDVRSTDVLFAGIERRVAPRRDLLIKLYEHVGRTADDLPYTPHFEQLYEPYIAEQPDPKPTRAEVWRHLLNLRKAAKLPKLGEARSRPPPLSPEERARLRDVLGSDIGKRDRLPYTERFDRLVDEFNTTVPRPLSPHLVWRAIATLAK